MAVVNKIYELRCSECGCIVYTCGDCKEYFTEHQEIVCIDDKHVCKTCGE